MRPITKWKEGEVVPAQFPVYKEAKPYLVQNIGCFCSYCEKAYAEGRDLQVEHIQPKGFKDATGMYIYAHLENSWKNLLLSCASCNGADNKDTKNVIYGECHLPHLNNTFLSFVYDEGGVVMVRPSLAGKSKTNAEALLRLMGLDKTPFTSSPGDTRWKTRLEIWKLSQKYLTKYVNHEVDVDVIVDLAKGRGGWSIWFTVFYGHDEVRKALIEQFVGTAATCFDPNNHYEPICRNPENSIDPV